MGGTKRAIPIEKITNNSDRAVAFSKRRHGLYSKATELCLLSAAQVAILTTPLSSNSHVSFYSYGHSSADYVMSAFLKNERPKAELGLGGRWWENEALAKSEDPLELKSAIDSVSSMVKDLKALRLQVVEKHKDHEELVLHGTHLGEDYQIEAVSQNNNEDNGLAINLYDFKDEFDVDEIFDLVAKSEDLAMNLETDTMSVATTSQSPWSGSEVVEDGNLVHLGDCEDFNKNNTELVLHGTHQDQTLSLREDQIVPSSDDNKNNNNGFLGNLDEFIDLDGMFDFGTNSEDALYANVEMNNFSMATTSPNPYSDLCYA